MLLEELPLQDAHNDEGEDVLTIRDEKLIETERTV